MKKDKYDEPLKSGDEFVRFSKYGFVTGIVKEINYTSFVHSTGRVTYFKPLLTATTGVKYNYNECFKLLSLKTQEEADAFDAKIKRLQENKPKVLREKMSKLNPSQPDQQ